jgi:hypothetical protein
LLKILLVAALDIKMRDVPTVSSVNSLLSQYCKASYFLQIFLYGGAPTVRFDPVVPWAKAGPAAGESPRRKHTTFRKLRKYEITFYLCLAVAVGNRRLPISADTVYMTFFSLQILGIDSEFCIVESFVTGMVDNWPEVLRPHRKKFTFGMCVVMMALGIPMVTHVSAV